MRNGDERNLSESEEAQGYEYTMKERIKAEFGDEADDLRLTRVVRRDAGHQGHHV